LHGGNIGCRWKRVRKRLVPGFHAFDIRRKHKLGGSKAILKTSNIGLQ
jgi:hypothetical protein